MSGRRLIVRIAVLLVALAGTTTEDLRAQDDRSILRRGSLIVSETGGTLWRVDLETNAVSPLHSVDFNNFDIQYASPSELIIARLSSGIGLPGALQRLDLLTGQLTTLAGGPDAGNPIGVTVVPGHGYYYTDHNNHRRVMRFDPRRGTLDVVASADSVPALINVDGIAHEPNGNLLVTGGSRLYRISPRTNSVQIVANLAGPYNLNGIVVTNRRTAIVAAHEPAVVLEIDLETGQHTTIWSGAPLRDPEDVALDHQGNLYILDSSFQHPGDYVPAIYRLAPGATTLETIHAGPPFGDIVDLLVTPFDGFR